MAEFLVNDVVTALRELDSRLRQHVSVLDEKPSSVNTTSISPVKSPTAVTSGDHKRNDKVDVSISVIFAKVNGIDTIKDRFMADVQIQIKWREPAFDHKKLRGDDVKWDQVWTPKLNVANAIGDLKIKTNFGLHYDDKERATVVESRQVSGTFFEFMELNKFPFDSQDLTVTLVSERTTAELELAEDTNDKCGLKPTAFNSIQEWKMLPDIINVWTKTVTKKSEGVKSKHPGLSCAVKTSRRPEYYMYNIIMLLSMMGSFSMATFTVAITAPQFRIQLTFFLMLTTITFKFTVNKSLPKIPYLTYMDKYIISIMLMIFLVCVWHAVVGGLIHPMYVNRTTVSTAATTTSSDVSNTRPTTPLVTMYSSSSWYSVDDQLSNVTTSWPLDVGSSTAGMQQQQASYYTYRASDMSYPVAPTTQLADRVALGLIASLFVTIHAAFFIAAGFSYRDLAEGPNSTDEDDDKKGDDDE